jgi:hypothetical protein
LSSLFEQSVKSFHSFLLKLRPLEPYDSETTACGGIAEETLYPTRRKNETVFLDAQQHLPSQETLAQMLEIK